MYVCVCVCMVVGMCVREINASRREGDVVSIQRESNRHWGCGETLLGEQIKLDH